MKLTPKQEKFCAFYVETSSPILAYSRAYNADGSKQTTKAKAAHVLLKKPEIAARIAVLRERLSEFLVSEDSILREFARVGFSDIRRMFDANGNLKNIHDLDDETAASVASVKLKMINASGGEIEYVKEIRLWPKHPALDSLAKSYGIYEKDNKQKKPDLDPLGELLKAISDRPRKLPGENNDMA